VKVVVNGRSLVRKQQTGIGRSTFQLLQALGHLDSPDEYLCYAPLKLFGGKTVAPTFPSSRIKVVSDHFSRGPSAVGAFDVYHAPSIEDLSQVKKPIVVTIHDVIHKALPYTHTRETQQLSDAHTLAAVSRASMLVCPSEHTRADLIRYYDADPSRTRVVPWGVDETIFKPFSDEEKSGFRRTFADRGLKKSFVLFVGTIEPRKNLAGVLRAFARMKKNGTAPEQLVVVGGHGWLSEGIEAQVAASGLNDQILRWGRATDEELCVLYNLATVYAYPSLYEGFGLPILEAFACRTPVVTSLTSSCGEVAGDAALTVDPADDTALAEALARCVSDAALCASLVEKGTARLRGFSFDLAAEAMAKIYREAA
jgi:glycosyltransferase involved in cell wall biosynthesis